MAFLTIITEVILRKRKPTIADQIPIPPPPPPPPFKVIISISDLTLRAFIQCVCYSNLNVLGTGTPQQLQDAFTELLSQYYEASGNTTMSEQIKTRGRLHMLVLHSNLVKTYINLIKERYTDEAGAILIELFKNHPVAGSFSLKFPQDIKKAETIEIRTNMEIKRLKKQIKENEPSQKTTENELIDRLLMVSKFMGVGYNMDMSVREYARAQYQMQEYYVHLQSEKNK